MSRVRISIKAIAITALMLLCAPASADVSGVLPMCDGCHGADGRGGGDDTPIIAGLLDIVQEDALFSYLDGDRKCTGQPMMCSLVSGLTEDQIIELAAHFAAMPYASAEDEFDAALADAGKAIHDRDCAICHGADGPDDAGGSPLHGQRKAYLRYALERYAAGDRMQPAAKEKKLSALSSDDVEALLNYYASYRN